MGDFCMSEKNCSQHTPVGVAGDSGNLFLIEMPDPVREAAGEHHADAKADFRGKLLDLLWGQKAL